MAIKRLRSNLSARATARGSISVFRNRDINDILPSQIVEQQFPEFIRSDYPKMVDFAKAYFSFLEQTENGKIDDIKNLDKTSGEYILRIRNEFAFNASEFNFLEDKEFIRYAKYFYSSKGTEESIKFLFRVMFDEAVEIEYPGERIFKPSTARWFQEQSVKVVIDPILSLPPTDFIGNYLQIRNAQGAEQTIEVSDVLDITEKLSDDAISTKFEIFFTTELLIPVSIGDAVFGTQLSSTIIPSLTSLKIISPGNNFRIGQVIKLDSITGSGAVAVITNVRADGEIRNVKFLKFGKNYTTNFYLGIVPEGVFTDSGSSFISGAGLNSADINRAIKDITEGFIETQSILRSDYVRNDSPVTAESPFSNYMYSAYTGVYVSQSSNRQVFFLEEDYSALLLSSIGAVCKYPGKYLDQTGMASNSSVLQDNNVFQDFSYIIKTTSDVEEYKETITALAHPAGFKMFGDMSIENVFDSDTNLPEVTNTSDLYVTDFDFTASDTLDNRITYTRTGTATRVNSAGLVETVAANTPRFDYTPVTLVKRGLLIEEARTNLLTHSDTLKTDTWTASVGGNLFNNFTASPSGAINASSFIETTASGVRALTQNTTITAGTTVAASIFVKQTGGTTRHFRIQISSDSGANGFRAYFNLSTNTVSVPTQAFGTGTFIAGSASIQSVGNGWYRLSCAGTVDQTATSVSSIGFMQNTSNGSATYTGDGVSGLYIWGAQVEAGSAVTSYIPSTVTFTSRASSGTYFDSTGTLQTAATNVARYQYNPSNLSVQPFLLLEEARINKIRNNTMVGAVAGTPGTLPTNWVDFTGLTGLTRQIVGTGTESGITYLDLKLSGTPSGSGSYLILPESITQVVAAFGQTWTSSFYYKLQAGSFAGFLSLAVSISERDAAGTSLVSTNITVANPTATLVRGTGTAALSNVSTARVTGDIRLVLTGAAIDITLRIGLPQLELGAFATSVIKTTNAEGSRAADVSTSAAATRGADTAVVTGSNFNTWFNATEGTLYAEYVKNIITPTVSVASFENSATNFMRFISGTTAPASQRFDVLTSGSDQASLVMNGTETTGLITKIAGAYKLNDIAAAAYGVVSTDTAAVLPTGLNRLGIGTNYAGTYLNGYVRRLTYYPLRLSNAEIRTMTQPVGSVITTQDYSLNLDFIGNTVSIST